MTATRRISIRTYALLDNFYFGWIGYHILLSMEVSLVFSIYCLMDQYNHHFSFVAEIMVSYKFAAIILQLKVFPPMQEVTIATL